MDIVFSKEVKILPWIGKNYLETNPKIFVLGMSTYNKDDPPKTCVRIMAKKVSEGDRQIWARYWVRITDLLKGDNEETKDFWDRISFNNYVQEIMDESKQETPREYWESAKCAFKETIEKLLPDIVVVTGYETFYNLPDECIPGKSVWSSDKELELKTCKYSVNDRIINICGMKHPTSSYGFKMDDWRSLYRKYYKTIMKNGVR